MDYYTSYHLIYSLTKFHSIRMENLKERETPLIISGVIKTTEFSESTDRMIKLVSIL